MTTGELGNAPNAIKLMADKSKGNENKERRQGGDKKLKPSYFTKSNIWQRK